MDAVPANNPSRVVISVKPGTYREVVKVPANKPHVTVQGTGGSRKDTVIVHGNAAGMQKPDGSGTYGTPGSATSPSSPTTRSCATSPSPTTSTRPPTSPSPATRPWRC